MGFNSGFKGLNCNLTQDMVMVFDHLTDQVNEVRVLWNVCRSCKPCCL